MIFNETKVANCLGECFNLLGEGCQSSAGTSAWEYLSYFDKGQIVRKCVEYGGGVITFPYSILRFFCDNQLGALCT